MYLYFGLRKSGYERRCQRLWIIICGLFNLLYFRIDFGLIKNFVEICSIMKTDKAYNDKAVSSPKPANKGVNPFVKLLNDKARIAEAVKNNQPLSSLKDIKFVRPI